MGGLGSSRVLSSEPEIMREDLNEWVALDKPGHYLLYVSLRRRVSLSWCPSAKSCQKLQARGGDFERSQDTEVYVNFLDKASTSVAA